MDTSVREQAAVLALTKATRGEWYRTASLIAEAGSALRLLNGDTQWLPTELVQQAVDIVGRVQPDDLAKAEELIGRATAAGARLTTVLDDDYPDNLHQIYNRPPFLFIRGSLVEADSRSIAVVGTRRASPRGLEEASALATELAGKGITVLSGLALGVDAAAHRAALAAGGRTVAVIGTGIMARTYPAANEELATQIVSHGAVVSQFWPEAPPTRYSFPMRNVVMSGVALGTVVVEASATSGAKMQARLCLEHGKRLFLMESLIESQEWARRYSERPGVTVVRRVDDIVDVLVKICRPPEQLALAF